MITEIEYKVLESLKDSLLYSVEQNKYILVQEKFTTREEIQKKCSISKQTLSAIIRRHPDFFVTDVKKIVTKDNPFKIIQTYGLSNEGLKIYFQYYEINVLPNVQKNKVEEHKKDILSFYKDSKNKFHKLNEEDIRKFSLIFGMSMMGITECPFEIQIKIKDKFKKIEDVYALYMDKELI